MCFIMFCFDLGVCHLGGIGIHSERSCSRATTLSESSLQIPGSSREHKHHAWSHMTSDDITLHWDTLCALPQPSQAQLWWEGHSKNRSQMINKIILFQANLLPCDVQNEPSSPKKTSLLEQGDTWHVSQAPRGKPNHLIPFYLWSWVSDVYYQRRKWNYWQHSSKRECAVPSSCSIVFTKHLNQYWCDYCLTVNFP